MLHKWLTKRMRFHPHGRFSGGKVPGPDDLKFVCRGQLSNVWEFVISHVHHAETVAKVRGNLVLNRAKPLSTGYRVSYKSEKSFSHEREALLEQRQSLSAELSSTAENITELKKDLKSLREEIASREETYQMKKSEIRDVERRTCLLKAASQHASDETAKLNEYLSLVKEKTEHFQSITKQNSDPIPMFTKESHSSNGRDRALESANTRDVRECCSMIASFLGRSLQGSLSDSNSQELERSRNDLWQRVDGILNSYASSQVMAAICDYTGDTVEALVGATAAIDIRKDAEKLRFKHQSGGQLSDVSLQPSVLLTVRQLLEENQEATFARFITTEKSLNRAWKMQQTSVRLSEKSGRMLAENHRVNPGALELAKGLYQTEMALFTSNSLLKLLTEISGELKEDVSQLSTKKKILFAKHQKIQNFKRIADGKQNLIRDLIKQNMDSRMKLQMDQTELLKYTQRMSGPQNVDVNQMSLQLHNCVSKEIGAFARLKLPYLLLTSLENGDKIAVVNLSINRLANEPTVSGHQTIQRMLKVFQYPRFKASECFLQHVVSLVEEVMEASLQLDDRSSKETNSCQELKINALCEDVRKSDSRQVERLIPPLQKRLNDATQCLANCLQVKDIVLSWWEQPAQVCTPWITVDGLGLQQWRDQWTVAATRMRHLNSRTAASVP